MKTLRRIYIPIQTYGIDIREDANSQKVIQCKYLSRSFCMTVDWSSQTDSFLPPRLLIVDALLPLGVVAQKMERFLVSVLRQKLHGSPLEH